MQNRDVVSWSAMISGYHQSCQCKEALEVFHKMQLSGVEPNEVTMVSVLASCAVLGALETGRWLHSLISRKKLALTITLGTVLVDFYAKCGSIETSIETFNDMPRKNVLTWTVLIQGMASNGKGRLAITYLKSMIESGIRPNDVTFVAVLSACSHAGLVEEGWKLFRSMTDDYGITPRIDHYGCMVDILSRSGELIQAYQFIRSMPIQPNAVIWRTLLGSCKLHKNVEIGEEALSEIRKLDPTHSGDYVLLSSIYASVGRFEDALRVRAEMKTRGIKKSPGCTSIEIGGSIHEFFAGDTGGHSDSNQIYAKVEEVVRRIKQAGYVPKIEDARFDVEDDEKETSVSHHSEKLAIAYGLMKSRPGEVIRITKNLRVCSDCHAASKLISKVFEREIVVRDRNRFHHFNNGNCSCNDYW
ncbi:hypothetical protein ZOSMA_13G00800 [Zostera marina]|uniref:DYW domain-containing protein n=1 Tax=Zostera marina TaxID=29655 RepID=A0A0K9PXY5_ZOSMR|nr:hypothetical protein ZOSMA_13G00800 [Zostera marina]